MNNIKMNAKLGIWSRFDGWVIIVIQFYKHTCLFFMKMLDKLILCTIFTGEQAKGFFMQSGLPTPMLGQIW